VAFVEGDIRAGAQVTVSGKSTFLGLQASAAIRVSFRIGLDGSHVRTFSLSKLDVMKPRSGRV
jgi:hypothetical protein